MLLVWYMQKNVCRWIGSSISQPSSCQREQERLEAAQWCLPRVRSDQDSCIRRFIGRLAAFNEQNLYSMRFLLVSLPFTRFYKYQYHPVSVWDASNLDCGTCHHCEAAGGRVSNGILWAGPIGVAMSRALGAPRLQRLVRQWKARNQLFCKCCTSERKGRHVAYFNRI